MNSVQMTMARRVLSRVWSASNLRLSSSVTDPSQAAADPPYFRTRESNILNHDERHLGRIFEMEPDVVSLLGCDNDRKPNLLVSKDFFYQMQAFQEYCFLVRKPMLEAAKYVEQLDARLSQGEEDVANARFVVWGEDGCGKTTTLSYAAAACHARGFVVCNFYQMRSWFADYGEMQQSEWNVSRFDHVAKSAAFLSEFLLYNRGKIDGLETHEAYGWSEREKTEKGSPLLEVVSKGIERPKFAGDCLGVLLKELRLHCRDGRCKVAVVVDGVSVLFNAKTLMDRQFQGGEAGRYPTKQRVEESVEPHELSVVLNVKKMLRDDYPNAITLVSTDVEDKLYGRFYKYPEERRKDMRPELQSHYPFSLLGEEGWRLVDPFVPIQVDRYTPSEMDVMIDYFLDRRYINGVAGTEAGRAEVHFLTGRHPGDFAEFSKWW